MTKDVTELRIFRGRADPGLSWGLNAIIVSLWERRTKRLGRHTQRGHWRWRQRLEWCGHKLRNSKDFWQPPEARSKEWISLGTCARNITLPTLGDFWFP
jgi:hypothetical protein